MRWPEEGAMNDQTEVLQEFAKICWQLRIEHDLFCSLFDQSLNQAELLQRTAPFLFGDVYAMLRNQLFLGFCRITDHAGSGKRTNLTTNFIAERLPWSAEVRVKLVELNSRLMGFRKLVEPARSRRVAHMDLRAQMEKETLGAFPPGADKVFFKDLTEFLSVAFQETTGEPFSLSVGGSTDTHQLVRALIKAELFDQCKKCGEVDRTNAILDAEQRM
jgi:hypothetical protein